MPEIGNADFVSLDAGNFSVNSKGFYKIRLRVNLDSVGKGFGFATLKMAVSESPKFPNLRVRMYAYLK